MSKDSVSYFKKARTVMNRNEAQNLIERLRIENEQWLSATKKAFMDGIFSIIERVRVEKKKDFILELIQNADDCNSTEISFDLRQSEIVIQNNGDPFRSDPDPTKNDIFAICKLGRTTKESGKIGFMGFGFRAVFEVSKKPEIYSGNFSFYFDEDMIVPHWIERIPRNIKSRLGRMKDRGSVFVLPDLGREIHRDVRHVLKKLSPTLLLYLQHLKRIRIGQERLQMNSGPFLNSFFVSRNDEERHLWKRYYSVPLAIPKELREFLRKDRNLDKIGKEPKKHEQISITFGINQDGKIADNHDTRLYAFLPLADEKNTGFAFNIQADFSVDAGRRKLREPHSRWNQWILANVYKCFPSVLKDYKDQRHLRTELYKILPLNDPERPEYLNIVKKKIDGFIQNEDSVLVKARKSKKHPDRRKWVKPEYAVMANSELQKLFDGKDLLHLFGKRKFYVADDEIDSDGMRYVQEMVKDELYFDEAVRLLKDSRWIFARKIRDRKNPEKWLGDLIIYFASELDKKLKGKSSWQWDYNYEKGAFIRRLSGIKFLLTVDGKLRRPQKIFLSPSEDINIPRHLRRKYSIVNRKLVRYLEGKKIKSEIEKARREKGLRLLRDLASELSPETIVKEIINQVFSGDNWEKYSDSTLRKYTDFIRKHENCWREADIKLKVQTEGEERDYRGPNELHLGSKYGNEFDLDTLYRGYEADIFVSLDYVRKLLGSKSERAKQQIGSWKKLFINIGAKRIPEIRKVEKEYVWREEIEKELEYPVKVMDTDYTYSYPGYAKRDYDFDSSLKKILSDCLTDKVKDSCKRLKILIRLLDRNWDYYSKYLEAEYGWHKSGQSGRTYEKFRASSFAIFLRDSNWVPTKDGKHLKPEAVAIIELRDIIKAPIIDYKLSNEEFKKYLQNLGLQTKPTVEGAIAVLKSLVDQRENKLGKFRQIYTYLAQHKTEKKNIREKLASSSCIFVPNREKKYWKISEVFWEGGSSFLEWRTDVGETYTELKHFFLDVLDVKEKPTHKDYVEFLRSYLWKKLKLTKREKSSLGHVYHHLNYIVSTPELRRSEAWVNLKERFQMWCEDNYWVGIDENIFYNDNEKLYELFKNHTDMIFAYIPEVPKNLEVKALFAELGIRGLSECYVERCAVSGEQITAKEEYQNEMRRISKYVAQFVKQKSPETFDRLNQRGVFSMLSRIMVKFVENFEVEVIVDEYTISLGEMKSFYSWGNSENCLYLEQSLQGNVSSCLRHIGIAFANAFGKDIGLETLVPYISGMEETEIHQAMQDYGIPVKEELKIEEPRKGFSEAETEKPPVEKPPPIEKPPVEKPPPKIPLHERVKVITEKQIRDSRLANWVKSSYGYHCQICLSKEKPEVLTYSKSYAGRKANRKSIIQAHHVKKVVIDKGHDHPGNYLSLCRHHHVLVHNLNLSLNDLNDSLGSDMSKKEIVWPNGETVRWNLITLSNGFMEGNRGIQIVISQKHLEKLEEYIDLVARQPSTVSNM